MMHGDMVFRDGWWYCHGFDGEGCGAGPTPIPDQYWHPEDPQAWHV
jgi:hypothetical protein